MGRSLARLGLLFSVGLGLTACGPAHKAAPFAPGTNATGFQATDGKLHTGAGVDQELAKLKSDLAGGGTTVESVPQPDRELSTRILGARIETAPFEKTGAANAAIPPTPPANAPTTTSPSTVANPTIRVWLTLRDAGLVIFDFTNSHVAPKTAADSATDIRYKAVTGRTVNGDATSYELALLCRRPGESAADFKGVCKTATLALQDKQGAGAKAGIVVRHQEVFVLAKAPKAPKNDVLKNLVENFKVPKNGTLQSFEVAWGPSGFALDIGDSRLCPAGRLVETNDLDEPLKLNCAGVSEFRDLEGRMIGNTTRGELFLELVATTWGLVKDGTENAYILVRKVPSKPSSQPKSATPPGQAANAPDTGRPSTAPTAAPPKPSDDTDADDDEDPVLDAGKNDSTSKGESWLVPINFNNPLTKTWARDRKHASIEKGVKVWLKDNRLKNFATHYIPNRDLVTKKLGESQVPAEFALITLMESNFFKIEGYPIEGPKGSSAYGPWQMLDDTATGNGLRIFPRLVQRRFIPGNPCDDRADLAKSTAAAGRYLRSIIDMFPYDPKLVLLGYNQGEFGVRGTISSLKRTQSESRLAVIKEMGLSFWTIRRFNMAKASGIHYVENFVSAYHAALEMPPVTPAKTVAPWRPNPLCK